MIDLTEVLTLSEAAEMIGCTSDNLRMLIRNGSKFIKNIDYRKSSKGIILISKSAVEREYKISTKN